MFSYSSEMAIRVLIGFFLMWICVLFVFISYSNISLNSGTMIDVKHYNKILQQLRNAETMNKQLQNTVIMLINEFLEPEKVENFMVKFNKTLEVTKIESRSSAPNLNYELMRRRIRDNVIEMWNFFSNELKQLGEKLPNKEGVIYDTLKLGAEYKYSLLNDMERMRENDGHDLWREQEAENLSDLIQRRLYFLQNPSNCSQARKVICSINKKCGYGCQLHHLVYCFIIAYATNRTFILESKKWAYNKSGWESVFQPVSYTCYRDEISNYFTNPKERVSWERGINSLELVLPAIDDLCPRPSYLPPSIPKDLAPRIKRLHRSPIVWWIGQFLKFILQPQYATKNMLAYSKLKLDWPKYIVGVHIRRTDKLDDEAAFHSLKEYMSHVEEFFLALNLSGKKFRRNIYLATDDNNVITEALNEYPQYRIYSKENLTVESKLKGIILDIHFLSLCDYLVCTFSSQVCRVAYEIMQTLHVDASDRFKSLDDIYYFGGQHSHYFRVVIPHKARNDKELNLEVNDLVKIAGNYWNGYSVGENIVTQKRGLFPTFKVIDNIEEVEMPSF